MEQRPTTPGLYATEPHQPTYRPPAIPRDGERDSLLDLRTSPTRAGGTARDDAVDSRARAMVAVAVLAALVLLAAGTILAASLLHERDHSASAGPSTSASTTRSASRSAVSPAPQAKAAALIDTAITRSVAARTLIGPANARTRACRATNADVQALHTAATTRTQLVTQVDNVDVHALTGGAAVVADLRQAWTYSARADLAYAAWARHHLSCSGHAATNGNDDWDRAHHNDILSSAAKARAVEHWNPVARRYHLAARAAGAI